MSLVGARRVLLLVGLMLVSTIGLPSPAAAATATAPQTEAQRVIQVAQTRIGARWVFAATGPMQFDCSGFVFWVYREAGLRDRIGSKRRTAAGYRKWFRDRGQVSRTLADARPGDVLIWGRDQHAGIYLGDNLAISALVNPYGVKIHRVDKISLRLTAVLHVQLER